MAMARSATSTEHDISMVLKHSILSEEDFLTDMKKKPHDLIEKKLNVKPKKPYDDHKDAVAFLKKGFRATKYNYSNDEKKIVNVWLSPCEKLIFWESEKKSAKWTDKLRMQSRLKVKKIV